MRHAYVLVQEVVPPTGHDLRIVAAVAGRDFYANAADALGLATATVSAAIP